MYDITSFEVAIADFMQRRYVRIVGRGTTALYVALRALAVRDGLGDDPGEIILPDLICSNVLDAVVLAGFTPRFADVLPDRFNADPDSVRQVITPKTRAVIAGHIFGYVEDVPEYGVPVIEDAVQGLGGVTPLGRAVGSLSEIAFTSFHPTKMIGGYGGAVATDDPALWEAIQRVPLDEQGSSVNALTGPIFRNERLRRYHEQIQPLRPQLIRPFDPLWLNIEQVLSSWPRLAENVAQRNERAFLLRTELHNTGLYVPEIHSGDAIWRYTFAAPSIASANWIARHLQSAGLPGSRLYPSLSGLFAPGSAPVAEALAPRLLNLWVDASIDNVYLQHVAEMIREAPKITTS